MGVCECKGGAREIAGAGAGLDAMIGSGGWREGRHGSFFFFGDTFREGGQEFCRFVDDALILLNMHDHVKCRLHSVPRS